MFVLRQALAFDLEELIERTIDSWSEIKASGLIEPPAESYGDFIAEEMNRRGLRQLDTEQAMFSANANESQFREAIIAALDRWLLETDTNRTPEQKDDYNRPLGE